MGDALASAKKELADRRDDASKCIAELKAAQSMMGGPASAPRNLTVTLREIYGEIAIDRVAVRCPSGPTQEKVVAEGIPCVFRVGAGVSTFDLVLMAEQAAPSEATAVSALSAAAEAAAAKAASVGSAEGSTGAVTAEIGAGVGFEGGEDNDDDQPAATTNSAEHADADAAAAVETQEGPEGDEVVVGATAVAEPSAVVEPVPVAEEPAALEEPAVSLGNEDATSDSRIDDTIIAVNTEAESVAPTIVPEEGDAAESETPAPVVSAAVDGEQEEDGVVPAEALADDAVVDTTVDIAATAVTAAAIPDERAEAVGKAAGAEEVIDAATAVAGLTVEPNAGVVATVTKTAASAASAVQSSPLGCSTITTEIVVPSSELDFEAEGGQWRYLEAGAAPGDGEDTSPVEVSKGVRFSTTLVAEDSGDAESRIIDLSSKCDEAERRLRAAEIAMEKLEPTPPAQPITDRKPPTAAGGAGGGSARKSALKKGSRRKQDGSRSVAGAGAGPKGRNAGGGGGGGVMASVTSKIEKVYGMAKPFGLLAWSCRNLAMFAGAVVAMHYHGEYLAV